VFEHYLILISFLLVLWILLFSLAQNRFCNRYPRGLARILNVKSSSVLIFLKKITPFMQYSSHLLIVRLVFFYQGCGSGFT
jgi:hypothetical protein